ncbi:MAG: Ig-like domain-containing protein, partial [Prevotella sp.]|nr:Ig-like domain-containing protein [Prevotella sp.]
MKKKIFTLLTLMLAVCGGAWAQDVTPGEANSTYLDISKYSTIADAGFSTGNNATAISYYDESTDWLTVCAYVANQSTSQQKWITSSGSPGADSSKGGWSATDVFKGHSSYFSSGYRTLCVQSAKTISFKVTKCSEIRAYMMPRSKSGRTASMVIYEVDEEGNRNGEAVKTLTASTYNTASVLTASDLDGSKIYEACFLASTANNEFFYEVAFKLADSRTATSLTYSASEATVTLGETFVAPTLTKDPTDLEGVTFSSSNRAVATIDATGAVTILAGGVTTITAEFAGSNTQKPSSASYTLTVTDPSQTSYDSEGVNISWPFNTGAAGQTATITYSNTSLGEELIKSTNVVLGSSLSYNGTQDLKVDNTATGEKTTKIYQSDAGSATDSKHAINFTFTPKLGMTFTPTSVSFVATRCGTNGGAMAINWIDTENATVSLGTAAATSS